MPSNVTQYLLDSAHRPKSSTWTLLRQEPFQVLPCRIPFPTAQDQLLPAIQAWSMQSHCNARRFLELQRLSSAAGHWHHWSFRLLEAMLALEMGNADDAWHELQLAQSWRCGQEQEYSPPVSPLSITIPEWLSMSVIALAAGEVDVAEAHACEAIAQLEQNRTACVTDVLQDTRGDAMTVFAAIRLSQKKLQEAEMLLQLAHDAHTQAGDMEQMAVDLIFLADVDLLSGHRESARYLLFEAQRILSDQCDTTRHLRCSTLKKAIQIRLDELRRIHRRKTPTQLSQN